jgi:hypothetical protein
MSRNIGLYLDEDTISALDGIADAYDTDRAAVMRALLEIGGQVAEDIQNDDGDPLEQFIRENETTDAIQMTKQGNHPRWNPTD